MLKIYFTKGENMLDKKVRIINEKLQESDLNEIDLIDTPDNFFEEINAVDILEQSKNESVLSLLCSKTAIGGKLIINGTDALQLCGRVFYGRMPLKDACEYIRKMHQFNSFMSVLEYLMDNKWKINFSGVKECRYIIEAIKQ